MRNLLAMVAILLLSSPAIPRQADTSRLVNLKETIKATLMHLQPRLQKKEKTATELAEAIHTEVVRYRHRLDWKILVAILNHESSLRRDPQGCLKDSDACTGDYGVGQVRRAVWKNVEGMKFDRVKLMSDYAYGVAAAAKVLNFYRERYERRELNWYARYHSGTPEFQAVYMRHLNRSYAKINEFLEGYYFPQHIAGGQ